MSEKKKGMIRKRKRWIKGGNGLGGKEEEGMRGIWDWRRGRRMSKKGKERNSMRDKKRKIKKRKEGYTLKLKRK